MEIRINGQEWGVEFLEEVTAGTYGAGWALVAGDAPMVETDMVEGTVPG